MNNNTSLIEKKRTNNKFNNRFHQSTAAINIGRDELYIHKH